MNTVVSAIVVLKVLLMQAPFDRDRSLSIEERAEFERPYAEAIAKAAHTYWEVALLESDAISETHMARYVIEGRCMDGPVGQQCDAKHGAPQARGVWQLHEEACRQAWAFPEASRESIMLEAECAIKLMRHYSYTGRGHALTPNHAAFCGMGARPWNWAGADERVKLAKVIYRQLVEAAR